MSPASTRRLAPLVALVGLLPLLMAPPPDPCPHCEVVEVYRDSLAPARGATHTPTLVAGSYQVELNTIQATLTVGGATATCRDDASLHRCDFELQRDGTVSFDLQTRVAIDTTLTVLRRTTGR